ncbi:P-loop containing nucleoside triphosphate hydrolase protein [Tuber magnatum]|uniref:P-loop containing nucleoside triphosphate hydrolase protein n=1 Tax=Tuber magnatum TaxID=42249 RepID=A0A317SI07_9PEZI|nr:P-loop containing nucleoside triphosphate hydrolase protein [Tuber magnatum]
MCDYMGLGSRLWGVWGEGCEWIGESVLVLFCRADRLGDIATLVKFLRIAPFDDNATWSKHIAAPFKNASIESIANLRRILHSVTLRRSKGIINLPPRKDEVIFLDFSSSEQQLYEATMRMSRLKLDLVLKEGRIAGQNYVHVLQSILRLRLICAHGSELVGDNDTAGITSSHAINIDDIKDNTSEPSWSVKDGYQIFRLMCDANEDICALCEAKVGTNGTAGSAGDEDSPSNKKIVVIGHLTACPHLLCKTCGPRFAEEFDNAPTSAGGNEPLRGNCPLCGAYVNAALVDIKSDYNEDSLQDVPRRRKLKGRYSGPSTKVKALISSLLENKKASTASNPIKSVVFSCWTSHMDLIEIAFKDNSISFVRLDGSMTRAQRNRVMEDFGKAPEISVILISIMAGGLGLNLTAACKAYVMEPQFNPAAESQAIDRIHRLGQTRPVTTTRYIMRDSFEMKIVELQKKKTELANLSMSGRLSGKDAMAKKLEDLKTLFR